MWHAGETDEPPVPQDDLPDTGALHAMHLAEPVTCLSCGTMNQPAARYCVRCGRPLLAPDQETRLMARASARTDMGRVRENNEDSVGLWALNGVLLALVADGMGGAVGGEEASRLTVEAVQADFLGEERGSLELLTWAEEVISEKLAAAIQAANLAVIDRVGENAALRGMGTTATLAFVRDRRAILAHVGDSRAYLVDGDEGWISQITSDHSFVEALLAAGHITEGQARDHPMKNVLYRALGQTPDTTADLYDRFLKSGDRIVLCSDGLTRHVSPDEIARLVLQDDDPDAATQRLIDLANQRGGEDNISVIVIQMEGVVEQPAAASGAAAEDEPAARRDPSLPAPIPADPDRADQESTLTEAPTERRALLRALDQEGKDTIPARQRRTRPRARARGAASSQEDVQAQEQVDDPETLNSRPVLDARQAFRLDAEEDRHAEGPPAARPPADPDEDDDPDTLDLSDLDS